MKYIKRSIGDWLKFFECLNLLVKENKSIISKTINILDRLKDKELTNIDDEFKIINLLIKLNIEDLDEGLELLRSIESFYIFDKLILEIKELKDKYEITSICFYFNKNIIKTYQYEMKEKYLKIFTAKDVLPINNIDLKTNGLNEIIFKGEMPFIVDKKDLNDTDSNFNERIYCTNDFRIRNNLPNKEEMDLYYINNKRNKIFDDLVSDLLNYDKINICIDDPNNVYDNIRGVNSFYTFRTDGILLNQFNDELRPKKGSYLTSDKIKIKNANFCVICKIVDNEVKDIYLIIKKEFYEEVKYTNNMNRLRQRK